jgi:hypothetical protein
MISFENITLSMQDRIMDAKNSNPLLTFLTQFAAENLEGIFTIEIVCSSVVA